MIELQDILLRYGDEFIRTHELSFGQKKVYTAIRACRTAALGGHTEICPECGEVRISYNSCRNRHCPKCQTYRKEKWVAERARDLLDIGYYHAVFTIPAQLYPIFYSNQRLCYSLLFRCAWETVKIFAADPKYLGAKTGATAVLHTWGQQLQYHPHVHMIIPTGGLTRNHTWRSSGKDFFAPVRAMSKVFRAKLLEGLTEMYPNLIFCGSAKELSSPDAFRALVSSLYERKWVVYCKKPFSDAGCVLAYLGRYTHRVAISNERLVSLDDDRIVFTYRDSRDGNRIKRTTLSATEFLRRFFMHVLPKGFAKIRHYGLLASRDKGARLTLCKKLTHTPLHRYPSIDPCEIVASMIGHLPGVCRVCGCQLIRGPLLC